MANQKFLTVDPTSGGIAEAQSINTSAGSGDSGKLPALDSSGKLDNSFMPTGIGANTFTLPCTESLSAGDFINVWSNGGVSSMRKADATTAGKKADGFVLSAFTSGASATAYPFGGDNTALTGLTIGSFYFLATTAGGVTATVLTGSGNALQGLGVAISTSAMVTEYNAPIIRA